MISNTPYLTANEFPDMYRLMSWCCYHYGISDLSSKFSNIINPTENEKVLFCLEYGDDTYEYVTRLAKTFYEEHCKVERNERISKLKEDKINKRNKHVNRQKMNPYYRKEEWKK